MWGSKPEDGLDRSPWLTYRRLLLGENIDTEGTEHPEARFYEKSGWSRRGVVTSHLPTAEGVFPLDVWRYEIELEQS